jgi:hypothetical protein
MMALTKDKHVSVKDDLLHVRFSHIGIPTVNTHQISKPMDFTSPGKAPPPHCNDRIGQCWQEALSPRLIAIGHRIVQRVG